MDYWLEYYQDRQGRSRWRLTHRNGEIVGASTQGYSDPRDCRHNARETLGLLFRTDIHHIEGEPS